jgi:protein pelota
LIKPTFDSIHVKKLNDAVNLENQGHVCAILMEEGIAHLFLVSRSTSKLKAKIEKRIAKKKGVAAATGAVDKQKAKFYEQIV